MSLNLNFYRSVDLLESDNRVGAPVADSAADVRRATASNQAERDARRVEWARANSQFLADYNARVDRGGLMFNELRQF